MIPVQPMFHFFLLLIQPRFNVIKFKCLRKNSSIVLFVHYHKITLFIPQRETCCSREKTKVETKNKRINKKAWRSKDWNEDKWKEKSEIISVLLKYNGVAMCLPFRVKATIEETEVMTFLDSIYSVLKEKIHYFPEFYLFTVKTTYLQICWFFSGKLLQ